MPARSVSNEGLAFLKNWHWPGNVRELENLMQRVAALYNEDVIDVSVLKQELGVNHVSFPNQESVSGKSLSESLEMHLTRYFSDHKDGLPPNGLYDRVLREVEEPLIRQSLAATNGNQIKAADLLGLNRNTLRKKIRDLDIDVIRVPRKN